MNTTKLAYALTMLTILSGCAGEDAPTHDDDTIADGGSDQGGSDQGGSDQGGSDQGGSDQGGSGAGGSEDLCADVDCSHLDSACTMGVCDPSDGTCYEQAANEGQACNDGLNCTTNDACMAGVCEGEAVICNAPGTCSVSYCDEAAGGICVDGDAPDGSVCDDMSVCTIQDGCVAGQCGGVPRRSFVMPQLGNEAVLTGNTIGSANDFTASCGDGAASPDHEYTFSVTENDRAYRFSTANGDYDTVLHLRQGCEDASFACNDDSTGTYSELAAWLQPGQYNIVVDGKGAFSAGNYELHAAPIPHTIGVLLNDSTSQFTAGDGGGASDVLDKCPAGKVLVGLTVRHTLQGSYYYPAMARMAAICADYDVTMAADKSYSGNVVGGTNLQLPWRGTLTDPAHIGSQQTATCPPGTMVVGFSGYQAYQESQTNSSHFRKLTLACAPMATAGNDVDGVTFTPGTDSWSNSVGDSDGCVSGLGCSNTINKITCPAGSIASGIVTASGEIVHEFGLRCDLPASLLES